MGSDGRDSAIQIFDRFLSLSSAENNEVLKDITYICFAAVSSILLSSKLHEGKSLLTMANFPYFRMNDLVEFESMLLNKIGYQITPLSTPSSFVRHLLGLCPEYVDYHIELIEQADKYISEFIEEPDYVVFAPSTIAISSLLISFSILKLNCSLWLSRIPNICFLQKNTIISMNKNDLFDIDLCLSCFQRIHSVLIRLNSPTTTVSLDGLETETTSQKAQKIGSGSPVGVDTPCIDGGKLEEEEMCGLQEKV